MSAWDAPCSLRAARRRDNGHRYAAAFALLLETVLALATLLPEHILPMAFSACACEMRRAAGVR